MNRNHVLLLGSSSFCESWRTECCDLCSVKLWIPKAAATVIDEEEDKDRSAEVLCVDCGIAKYGAEMVNAARLSLE